MSELKVISSLSVKTLLYLLYHFFFGANIFRLGKCKNFEENSLAKCNYNKSVNNLYELVDAGCPHMRTA